LRWNLFIQISVCRTNNCSQEKINFALVFRFAFDFGGNYLLRGSIFNFFCGGGSIWKRWIAVVDLFDFKKVLTSITKNGPSYSEQRHM
jgi:hypothetical protein